MDIQAVATAIIESLANLDLHGYDYGPDSPTLNAVYVYPDDNPQWHDTFTGEDTQGFVVRFLIGSTFDQGGQAQLNALLSQGDGSASAAIEDDDTLGGVVQSIQVTQMRNYGVLTLPDATRCYSAELVCDVFT